MKPTDYIEWDNLKDIPFFLCQVVEDREKQDLNMYLTTVVIVPITSTIRNYPYRVLCSVAGTRHRLLR